MTRVEDKLKLRFKDLMITRTDKQKLIGQNDAGAREQLGLCGPPIQILLQVLPSTNGRNIYGHDNPMSKPRQDVNSDGTWAIEQGAFYADVDLTDILPDHG